MAIQSTHPSFNPTPHIQNADQVHLETAVIVWIRQNVVPQRFQVNREGYRGEFRLYYAPDNQTVQAIHIPYHNLSLPVLSLEDGSVDYFDHCRSVYRAIEKLEAERVVPHLRHLESGDEEIYAALIIEALWSRHPRIGQPLNDLLDDVRRQFKPALETTLMAYMDLIITGEIPTTHTEFLLDHFNRYNLFDSFMTISWQTIRADFPVDRAREEQARWLLKVYQNDPSVLDYFHTQLTETISNNNKMKAYNFPIGDTISLWRKVWKKLNRQDPESIDHVILDDYIKEWYADYTNWQCLNNERMRTP